MSADKFGTSLEIIVRIPENDAAVCGSICFIPVVKLWKVIPRHFAQHTLGKNTLIQCRRNLPDSNVIAGLENPSTV